MLKPVSIGFFASQLEERKLVLNASGLNLLQYRAWTARRGCPRRSSDHSFFLSSPEGSPRHLVHHPFRSRPQHAPLIPRMLPSRPHIPLSYPTDELFATQDWPMTLRFIVPLQRFLVTREHKLVKCLSLPDLLQCLCGIEPIRDSFCLLIISGARPAIILGHPHNSCFYCVQMNITDHRRQIRTAKREVSVRGRRSVSSFPSSDRQTHCPATVIRPILTVGAQMRLRISKSFPTISTSRSISFKFPAIVTSSTGKASFPFSIHKPDAPRE